MRSPSTINTHAIWTALVWFRRSPVGRIISRAVIVGFLAFLSIRLWQLWNSSAIVLQDVQPCVAAAAVVASALAVASYGCVWLVVLRRLGITVRPAQLAIFLKSQLGKYIPGSVWQYAGRVGLGRADQIPASVGIASIAVEVAASLVAAVIVGAFVLPLLNAVAVLVGVIAIVGAATATRVRALLRRVVGQVRIQDRELIWRAGRVVPPVLPLYGIVWLAYGLAFWLTARALFAVPASDIAMYIGAFALAWAVGFVAIVAPGGVGVREAMIVVLLAGHLGEAKAIVLAGASRILLTGIDLALGGLAVVVSSWRIPPPQALEARR